MKPTLEKPKTQQMATFPIIPATLRDRVINVKDDLCPFKGYEGNEEAVQTAISLAKKTFSAHVDIGQAAGKWHEQIWACSRQYPIRLLLTGPRSVGKTTFARNYAAIVSIDWANVDRVVDHNDPHWRLPWIELDGTGLKKRDEVLTALEMACRGKGLPLLPMRVTGGVRYYRLPPLCLFIDEVHCLPRLLMEGLLKMTERNDGVLEVGVAMKIDCRAITIITATTNPGVLKDTFLSRFPIRLDLEQHNLEQVAKIIQNKYSWPRIECLRLAELKPLPREALAVAQLIEDTRRDEKVTLRAAMNEWVRNLKLREGGLTDKAVEVLVTLAEAQPNGLSKENICASLSVEKEEFQRQLLPQLLRTSTHPAFVTVSGRHKITQDGIEELRRRGYSDY